MGYCHFNITLGLYTYSIYWPPEHCHNVAHQHNLCDGVTSLLYKNKQEFDYYLLCNFIVTYQIVFMSKYSCIRCSIPSSLVWHYRIVNRMSVTIRNPVTKLNLGDLTTKQLPQYVPSFSNLELSKTKQKEILQLN